MFIASAPDVPDKHQKLLWPENQNYVHWGSDIRTSDTEVDSIICTLKVRISESVQIVSQFG